MLKIARERIESLKSDYLEAKEREDGDTMNEIITEGKKWRAGLDVMERCIRIKEDKESNQFDKDVEEVFGREDENNQKNTSTKS